MTHSRPLIELPKGISQRQIADHIGISVSTVSRVLSGHQNISDRTRADVQRAIEELMGVTDQSRQVLSRMIGLTPSNLTGESYGQSTRTSLQESLEGAESVARSLGYMVYTWANSDSLLQSAGSVFFSAVQGVVMVGGVVDVEILDAIQEHNLPVVLAGGALPSRSVPSVGADAMYGATSAIEKFIQLGHTRIAIVNGPPTTYTTAEKRAGYLASLATAGIPIIPAYLGGGHADMFFNEQCGFEETQKLLSLDQPPTAIFYASDLLAFGGRAACQAQNLSIPEDISIIGYDGSAAAATSVPALSSVNVNRREWGAKAVERLIGTIDQGLDSNWRLLLPATLEDRESVGPPPNQHG